MYKKLLCALLIVCTLAVSTPRLAHASGWAIAGGGAIAGTVWITRARTFLLISVAALAAYGIYEYSIPRETTKPKVDSVPKTADPAPPRVPCEPESLASELADLAADRVWAVREAWKQEATIARAKLPMLTDWNPDQLRELKRTGKVSGYDGHHINSVKCFPSMADNPDNIRFLPRAAHLAEHANNWKTATEGALLNRSQLYKAALQLLK